MATSLLSCDKISRVYFTVYDRDRIEKLSVKKLTTSTGYDQLGLPVAGGLYDPCMGATLKHDVCSTCGLGSRTCPGHFANIDLPLPIFNPVFYRFLLSILKKSCIWCNSFHGKPSRIKLFVKKMELISIGMTTEALDLDNVYESLVSCSSDLKVPFSERERWVCKRFEKHCRNLPTGPRETDNTKNLVELKQIQLKSFLSNTKCDGSSKYCEKCGLPKLNVRSESFGMPHLSCIKKKDYETFKTKYDQLEDCIFKVDESMTQKPRYLSPLEVKKFLHKLFHDNISLTTMIFGCYGTDLTTTPIVDSINMFFLDKILVVPNRFRPALVVGDSSFDNPFTTIYAKILVSSYMLQDSIIKQEEFASLLNSSSISRQKTNRSKGSGSSLPENKSKSVTEQLQIDWMNLQNSVNSLYDSNVSTKGRDMIYGIRQSLEKKEGLFRMHMMGKRVNFAGRSVISPDPYLNVHEVGVPMVFAKGLTFPEPVNSYNLKHLREVVESGPNNYPGSNAIVKIVDGSPSDILSDKVMLSSSNESQRLSCAKQLLVSQDSEGFQQNRHHIGEKAVLRHVRNGDYLLVNRQPSLHRPSIMAHSARILPKESSLRLHYANCKAYNADFDGDEMNAHLPQNFMGRAEAVNLMSTVHHYLSPRDCKPLTGLIQDYVVSGVLLTLRDCFLTRDQYFQLVYTSLIDHPRSIKLLPPTIVKPCLLWTGKQVVSTLIQNITPKNLPYLNMNSTSKIVDKYWPKNTPVSPQTSLMSFDFSNLTDDEVIVRDGEWLSGILDKNQFGATAYGIIHIAYELYGGMVSSNLLSVLGRATISYLQYHGFTLGIKDVVCEEAVSQARSHLIETSLNCGEEAQRSYFKQSTASISELKSRYRNLHVNALRDPENHLRDFLQIEMHLKSCANDMTNKINQACLPDGLVKKFPTNSLQVMIQSGAKGSSVNAMQISCLLGQIELEGRRPPIMCSGKSLPTFFPYDLSLQSGGFVTGSFLSSLKPTEFFFHCMAGREGLVDTAVKTSRSGYLQRCIVKHLEGLHVSYDLSVRDSDGSVVQFLYGEDGCDPTKIQFAYDNRFDIFLNNPSPLQTKLKFDDILPNLDTKMAKKLWKKLENNTNGHYPKIRISPLSMFTNYIDENGIRSSTKDLKTKWYELEDKKRIKMMKRLNIVKKVPVFSQLRPDHYFGSVSETYKMLMKEYIDDMSKKSENKLEDFENLMLLKYIHSLCPPGEAVGVIAAQSIGEPSTQMTLNTFHFAGRGEMNVTLGIPRLREILMVASPEIKTPIISIPIQNSPESLKKAIFLEKSLRSIPLSNFLDNIQVSHNLFSSPTNVLYRRYVLKISISEKSCQDTGDEFTSDKILQFIESFVLKKLFFQIGREIRGLVRTRIIERDEEATESGNFVEADKNKNVSEDNGKIEEKSNKVPEDFEGRDDNSDNSDSDDSSDKSNEDADEMLDDDDNESSEEAKETVKRNINDLDDTEVIDGESEEEGDVDMIDEEGLCNDSLMFQSVKNVQAAKADHSNKKQKVSSFSSNLSSKNDSIKLPDGDDPDSLLVPITRMPGYVTNYEKNPFPSPHVLLEMEIPARSSTLKLSSIFKTLANKMRVNSSPGTASCSISNIPKSKKKHDQDSPKKQLSIEGNNIQNLMQYADFLCLDQLRCNNIHSVAQFYGIEAARATLIQEVNQVFGDYGITVNFRHLSLVADYMTYSGGYLPLNRHGIASCASPFQKMSFETTMNFLKNSCLTGDHDDINSPSAKLVVGNPVSVGTGVFQILMK